MKELMEQSNRELFRMYNMAVKFQGKWIVSVKRKKGEDGVQHNIFTLNTGETIKRKLTKEDLLNSGDVGAVGIDPV